MNKVTGTFSSFCLPSGELAFPCARPSVRAQEKRSGENRPKTHGHGETCETIVGRTGRLSLHEIAFMANMFLCLAQKS